MGKRPTNKNQAADAVATYLATSQAAVEASRRLHEAWRQHFEQGEEVPSDVWVQEVAAQQLASDLALGRAQIAAAIRNPALSQEDSGETESARFGPVRTRRRRRRENKFLGKLGKPGQRMLRAAVLLLLVLSTLVATAAGISLALEIAGFLHLIEDPTQMPVGIQLAIFVVATGAAYGLKKALQAVEQALHGSKGIRPKGFQL